MTNKFDWKTEDDLDWDRLPRETEGQPVKPNRRWPMLIVLVALLLGIGAFGARMVQQRAAENTAAMQIDVLSSHNLFRLADSEQDEELLLSLLSGRDSNWVATEQGLLKSDLLTNRRPFGLFVQPEQPPADENNSIITFSPDFLTAELASDVPYTIQVGNGLTETVTLQETAVYKLGSERWLRSPPDEDFWGLNSSQRGAKVTLTYPQRDTSFADRLTPDLDRKLIELCTTVEGLDCPEDLQVSIHLSSDPAVLLATAQPVVASASSPAALDVVLPSPSLVGLPQDDAAYQALFRGYAAQMATAVIARLVDFECCAGAPLFMALVDYQLSEVNLRPWPVTEADYGRIVSEQVRLQDLAGMWNSTSAGDLAGPTGWQIYTAVDYFLSANPDQSAADLQRQLSQHNSFYGWLNSVFSAREDPTALGFYSTLMRDWWMRGYTVAEAGSGGTAPPTQDIYLTCVVQSEVDEDVQVATLYQRRPDQVGWDAVYDTTSFLLVSPLPGDRTLLQQEFRFDDQIWATNLRQDGELIPLSTDPDTYTVSFGQTDPSGAEMAVLTFPTVSNQSSIVSFNLSDCGTQGCSSQPLPGIPIWSPDGTRALFTSDPDSQLALLQTELRTILFSERAPTPMLDFYVGEREQFADAEPLSDVTELTRLGYGHAPFWLDDHTVGYLTLGNGRPGRTTRLMTLDLAGPGNPQVLLTTDDLLDVLDSDTGNRRMWWIHYLMVHPNNPDVLYVVAMQADERTAHVFAYNRSDGSLRYLMASGFEANHSLGFSPDGRYIVLTGIDSSDVDRGNENALIQVYDTSSGEIVPFLSIPADFPPFSTYDWSKDGSWLALMLDENLVGLYAPAENRLQFLETPPGVCAAPAWLDPQAG